MGDYSEQKGAETDGGAGKARAALKK